MKRITLLALGVLSAITFSSAYAGVTVGATRVVFLGGNKETSLSVDNKGSNSAYLIRSWVSNYNEKDKSDVPFIATPPLFRIEKDQTNVIRLALKSAAGLTQDRESLFMINVLVIPPEKEKKGDGGILQFSFNNRLKLFYRPASLSKVSTSDLATKVKFNHAGKQLQVSNPTPFYVSFSKITVNGSEVKESVMVAPLSSYVIKNAPSGNKISWTIVDDYGGISKAGHTVIE